MSMYRGHLSIARGPMLREGLARQITFRLLLLPPEIASEMVLFPVWEEINRMETMRVSIDKKSRQIFMTRFSLIALFFLLFPVVSIRAQEFVIFTKTQDQRSPSCTS